jgi:cytochrome c peroxidase
MSVALAGAAAPIDSAAPLGRGLTAFGPWPVATPRDPGNRASGRPEAIEFGYRMFREPRFSPNGYIACISCHQTDRAFTDAIARAQGLAPVGRNTPALANLRLVQWFGWDGASDSLWMASLRPIVDAREIGADAGRVARVVRTGDGHACRYRRAFGAWPAAHDDRTVMVNVAKSIAAFAETLVTERTPFDHFRDALVRGDDASAAFYPAAARRGAELFVGRANCATCHAGPNFTDGRFHRTGPADPDAVRMADAGREDGLARWRLSAFNRYSRFSEVRARPAAADLSALGDASQRGRFRTPSLRNVAVTAPYMHDGSLDTLREAVRHHAREPSSNEPEPADASVARSPVLSASEVGDLVAFLETLTDAKGAVRHFPPRRRSPCE